MKKLLSVQLCLCLLLAPALASGEASGDSSGEASIDPTGGGSLSTSSGEPILAVEDDGLVPDDDADIMSFPGQHGRQSSHHIRQPPRFDKGHGFAGRK